MHELSIALSLVETALEAAQAHHIHKVDAVHLRLGVMSGVVKEALLFSYDIATEGTLLAGARLEIEELPLIVYCPHCRAERQLPGIQFLYCPQCETPASQIVQGKEIEIVSLEYSYDPAVT